MVTNMTFGKSLHGILSILDISCVRLSKVIDVDSSLVNRWVNEKRIPPYNSNYIEKMANYFLSCVLNPYQVQHLDRLFFDVCGESKEELNTKDKITNILLHSQGYSFECKNSDSKKKKDYTLGVSNDSLVSLSSEDKIVLGYLNIVDTCISLFEKTTQCKEGDKRNNIYISLNSGILLLCDQRTLMKLKRIMHESITKGWNILCSIQLNDNIEENLQLVKFIGTLIHTGKFFPFYFKKYNMISCCSEYIVVSGMGALLVYSNNSAFLFKNEIAIEILKNKAHSIISNYTKPLVKYFSMHDTLEYANTLAETENIIGNQIIYKPDFGLLLIPEELYKTLLLKKNLSMEEVNISLEFYRKRIRTFSNNVRNYNYTYIYHSCCINNLIKYRKLRLYMYNMIDEISLENIEVILILENIIKLLTKYEKFRIAFIPQDSNDAILEYVIYCVSKERNAVMLEAYQQNTYFPQVKLMIEEPLLVKAINAYLEGIIDQIAPINKDKNEIIAWIQYLISSH